MARFEAIEGIDSNYVKASASGRSLVGPFTSGLLTWPEIVVIARLLHRVLLNYLNDPV